MEKKLKKPYHYRLQIIDRARFMASSFKCKY